MFLYNTTAYVLSLQLKFFRVFGSNPTGLIRVKRTLINVILTDLLLGTSGMISDETECFDIQSGPVSEFGVDGAETKSYRIAGTDFRSLFRRP